ncbi:MAG: HepT-like ribonuclease domain-containing protein [Mycobacteriales bacterium]
MSRSNEERLSDILAAIERIQQIWVAHTDRGTVIDACLFHLVVIGEAVNRIDDNLLEQEPDIPWSGIVGLRNVVTHEYHRIDEAEIAQVITTRLDPLREAVQRLLDPIS